MGYGPQKGGKRQQAAAFPNEGSVGQRTVHSCTDPWGACGPSPSRVTSLKLDPQPHSSEDNRALS